MMRLPFFLTVCVCAISLLFALQLKSEIDNSHFLNYPPGPERKQAFITYLKPIIDEMNLSLINDRQKLIHLRQKQKLNIREQRWLRHISQKYNNEPFDVHDDTHWSALLAKIDIIPASLALAQSAIESGWGSSRFARNANNYFGQWCYQPGCGLVPNDRSDDASHEVAKYKSVKESVLTYIHNLNTNPAYRKLRAIRSKLRESGQMITGHRLADGLQFYSQRGQTYIREIQSLIRSNKLGPQKTAG